MASSKYPIYVLTVSHSNDLSALADQVFQEQGLDGNDALLTIDPNDRQVELVTTRDSELDQIIRSNEPGLTVADKYRAVTDRYFVPYARKGKYADAVIHTIRALDNL
ncbi:TPM domain-containing protein [Alicyclobacillus shizuokensis]|uniref:TPM domain-containing protein n=1 Tax=Alicyclobacillus shizuokensis TaxID=392014 RepID=UPI0014707B23|nr:TPM domain-containing protein [Alicyclobacillus shizuokensis]